MRCNDVKYYVLIIQRFAWYVFLQILSHGKEHKVENARMNGSK